MKETLMKYKLHLLVIVLVSTTVFTITNYVNHQSEITKVKQLLLKEQSKQSNADVISTTILDKKNIIVATEATIVELENKKKLLELEVTCWKNQMNRLVDGLEYNLQYCIDKNNLTKFKEGLD